MFNKSKPRSKKKSGKDTHERTKSKSKKKKHNRHKLHGHHAHHRIKSARVNHDNDPMKFRMKGKPVPPPKEGPSPSMLSPNDMTTFYRVPNYCFKDETDVLAFNGYEIGNEIGRGGFSIIFKGKNLKTGKPAAIKLVEIGSDQSRIDAMKNEIFIMEMMDNMYTIKLYLHFMINDNLFIIMQLADAGCFSSYLEKEAPLDEPLSARFFGQMVVGIEHLHENNIAHRDIKPGNFLMTDHKGEKILLVADYGLSRVCKKDEKGNVKLYTTRCGTPAFMAPEILAECDYNPYQYDVWSLGITLFGMLNVHSPFNYDCEDYGLSQMLAYDWHFTDNMKESPSNNLNDFMTRILEPNYEARITIKGMANHEWLYRDYQRAKKLEKAHKN